ncbi:MAG: DUF4363 family protein [Sarcina sp.]
MFKKLFSNQKIISSIICIILITFIILINNRSEKILYSFLDKVYFIEHITEDLKCAKTPEKWDNLTSSIVELENCLNANASFLSIYLSHEYLDLLSTQTHIIHSYASTQTLEEVSANLVSLKLHLEKFINLQKISFENIF